jgi:phage baseplate assembly protein W
MLIFAQTPQLATTVINGLPAVLLSTQVSDTLLNHVGATVSWGDGTSVVLGPALKPLNVSLEYVYRLPGTYVVTVNAVNYASPTPETISWSGTAVFNNPGYQPSTAGATPAYVGPIMPRTTGYPAPTQWNWQFATDNACLLSSLMLLLSTNRGERLMDPNYGTNLQPLVFSLEGPIVNDAIISDISQALPTYEPRAQVISIDPEVTGPRTITVAASFRSLINGQQISLQNLAVGSG